MPSPLNLVRPYSTGASYIYLGLGNSRAPLFFGTCEGYPKHERRPQFMPVRNDISGRNLSLDMSFQGEDATVSLDMTVWDEGMAQMLEHIPDVPGTTPNAGVPTGSWAFNDVGALMGLEELSIPIWIRYTFGDVLGGANRFSGSAINPGYHYYQGIPFAPITDVNGAQGQVRQFMFYVWPRYNFNTQRATLFDQDMRDTVGVTIRGPTNA